METESITLQFNQTLFHLYRCINCKNVFKQYEGFYAFDTLYSCPYCDYVMSNIEVFKEFMKTYYEEIKHYKDNIHAD